MRTLLLQFKPDTDVALLNAMMHVIVTEGLVDAAFIAAAPSATRSCAEERRGLQPRGDGADLRHPAETIREVARCTPPRRAR
jgi:formate dehydrogenase major subunit